MMTIEQVLMTLVGVLIGLLLRRPGPPGPPGPNGMTGKDGKDA